MAEFLPLCDVLFNVISMAGYFCDVVFDIVLGYALFKRECYAYFAIVITLVMLSLIISQIVSLRWYINKIKDDTATDSTLTDSIEKKKPMTGTSATNNTINELTTADHPLPESFQSKFNRTCVIALHCTQLGVLWRYAKLFVPVNLRHVKHEVRDLCMLRLLHAFCEAAPMLLLQLYILITIQQEEETQLIQPGIPLQSLSSSQITPVIVQQPTITQQHQLRTFKDLNIVSCVLSLFSVCWALASFSKNVRVQNVHRLVLTWLGVIFQFAWRLGTVISRVSALIVYASVYKQWIFLVIILHWMSMFFWLISPKNVFHGERISRIRKTILAGLIAFVYIFAYINLQEVNHRQKMITFYVVMFLENTLLVFLWLIGIWHDKPNNWYVPPFLILLSFGIGMFFMVLYYRYFHVRRLGYEAGGRLPADNSKYTCQDGTTCIAMDNNLSACPKYPPQIPGVFNCRFNPVGSGATKRKKKKPTSFVPPPNLSMQQEPSVSGFKGWKVSSSKIRGCGTGAIPIVDAAAVATSASATSTSLSTDANGCEIAPNGLMSIPFWRRPIPRSQTGGSSENEGSAGSRVNIHQKLQEKKQKQLAELKIIEEEIKQGKLGGPGSGNTLGSGDDGRTSLLRQPIPRTKKHNNLEPQEWRSSSPELCGGGTVSAASKMFNDLNVMSSATRNYDPLYNSFGLNGINIPALNKETFTAMENTVGRNMSPISSQISGGENSSLKRQILAPRTKIPHNIPRNPFAETYRGNFPNVFTDGILSSERALSMSPRNVTNSPNCLATTVGNGNGSSNNTGGNSGAGTSGTPGPSNGLTHFDTHPSLFLDVQHLRQISGTYSNMDKNGADSLQFPYNVIPPPRNKLDSRSNLLQSAVVTTKSKPINGNHSVQQQHQTQQQQQRINIQRQMQRAKTPEILLSPHYLDNSRVYYDWMGKAPTYRMQNLNNKQENAASSGDENLDDHDDSVLGQNSHRIPSDIDSQVSLPRSYTLPREFKYYRRSKGRKLIKNEHFINSTNSSDGDVDSCDDNESERLSNISNRNSNSSQRHLRAPPPICPKSSPPTTLLTPTTRNISNNNYHHKHMVAASPATVNYKDVDRNSPQNPVNNLQLLSQSKSSRNITPNYLKVASNSNGNVSNNNSNNLLRTTPTNSHAIDHQINNLNLINGVESNSTIAALHRQMRIRGYANNKNMVRHETKL